LELTLLATENRPVSEIAERYRRRADSFARTVAAAAPGEWSNQSPCADWTARDVVGHVVDMHSVMLRPLGRAPDQRRSVERDPLGAFRSARGELEAVLADPELAAIETDTPMGRMTVQQHIDAVASADMVIHRWDLARATGQDATIDPEEVARLWPEAQQIGDEMRTPGAFGPGIVVYGPEVAVPADAPLQDRLLGLLGRDPAWSGSAGED
jgi:uncharacterized protein (TIGR03086 family)